MLEYYRLKKGKERTYGEHKPGNMERLLGGAIAELGRKVCEGKLCGPFFHYSHG